jgi:hypothetical protein
LAKSLYPSRNPVPTSSTDSASGSTGIAHRPKIVTFLAAGVLILSAFYFTRALVILREWDFWAKNLPTYTNLYLLGSGLFWGISLIILAAGFWLGRRWARWYILVAAPLYLAFVWTERIVRSGISNLNPNWLFELILSLAIFSIVMWILFSKSVKLFFGDKTYGN